MEPLRQACRPNAGVSKDAARWPVALAKQMTGDDAAVVWCLRAPQNHPLPFADSASQPEPAIGGQLADTRAGRARFACGW
jgi:hypothetical protein